MNSIILSPLVTEKSMNGIKAGKYTFKVAKWADKNQIKKEVKEKNRTKNKFIYSRREREKEIMKIKVIKKKNSGRNSSGKVTVRHQGAEQKRFLRVIDFKRDKRDMEGRVIAFEYDPNRTVDIA